MFRKLIATALLIVVLTACNDPGGNFGSSSIADGAIKVWHGQVTLNAKNALAATISKSGDFSVNGKPVTIDAAQRELFLHYYAAATAIRQHGIETGKAGAALAGNAVKGAVTSAMHGDGADVQKNVDAQTDQVKKAAMKICDDLSDIRKAQNALASELTAFKPYGNLIGRDDVDDFAKD